MIENMKHRRRSIGVIAGRGVKSTLNGIGIYLAASLAFFVAVFLARSNLKGVVENGLMVMANPLNYPLLVAVIIGATYLALTSAISVARERDRGTLEVLFYGPVDSAAYVIAKFVEQMVAFLGLIVAYLVFFLAISKLTNFGLDGSFLAIAGLSFPLAASIVAFGLWLSAVSRSARTSVILLLLLLLVFFGMDIVANILTNLSAQDMSATLVYARVAVDVLRKGLGWVSPFAYLNRGITAAELGRVSAICGGVGASLLYTAVLLVLAIFFLERRGVRSR